MVVGVDGSLVVRWGPYDELKEFYDRLKANGKHTTVAQVAVIKKMIVIAHALYVNNCAYDAVFYKKQCGVNREIGVCA